MESSPRLERALGVSDLTWLYLVAIVNLNLVPVVASEGLRIMWLWGAGILFFFVPQGICVIELARRTPGEGGLYLYRGGPRDHAGLDCLNPRIRNFRF